MIPVYHPEAQVSPAVEDALCLAWGAMARAEGYKPMLPCVYTTVGPGAPRKNRVEEVAAELAKGPATAAEIAVKIGIKADTVRHNLSVMQNMGLAKNIHDRRQNIVWGLVVPATSPTTAA